MTSASWSDFSKWVRDEHFGWTVKRREATEKEKREHGETRQSKSYWIEATYKPTENNQSKNNKNSASKKRPTIHYDNSIADENIIRNNSSSSNNYSNKRSKQELPTVAPVIVHDNLVRDNNLVRDSGHDDQNNEYDEDTDDSILVSGLEPLLDYCDEDDEVEVNNSPVNTSAPVVCDTTNTTVTIANNNTAVSITTETTAPAVSTTTEIIVSAPVAATAPVVPIIASSGVQGVGAQVESTQTGTATCTPSPSSSPTPFVTPSSDPSSNTPPLPSPLPSLSSPLPSMAPPSTTVNQPITTPIHTACNPQTPASSTSSATPSSMNSVNSMSHTPIAPTSEVPGLLLRLHVKRDETTIPLGINIYAPQDPASLASSRVAIASVASSSVADQAGLCVGDVLVTMHGQLVLTASGPQGLDSAVALFRSLPPSFEVTVLR